MNKKTQTYAITVVVSLVLFFFSVLLGSVLNVLTAYLFGYGTYQEYVANPSTAVILSHLLIGIVVHLLFAWLTVLIIKKVALKNNTLEKKLFTISEGTVFFIGIPLLYAFFGKGSGALIYVVHIIGILGFGNHVIETQLKPVEQTANVSNTTNKQVTNERESNNITGFDGLEKVDSSVNNSVYGVRSSIKGFNSHPENSLSSSVNSRNSEQHKREENEHQDMLQLHKNSSNSNELSAIKNNLKCERDFEEAEEPKTDFVGKSDIDILREFKTMLDEGLITQDDYDNKKKEIMKRVMG